MDKPHPHLISKSKKNDFLESAQKEASKKPAPGQYETLGNMLWKKNF
jgi:hypothetical protein